MVFLPTAVASVGGLVVDNDRLLVVRHTCPPSMGQYMLPGGVVDPGEMLDAAVVREVAEETGIVAAPIGVAGVASIVHEGITHAYVFWLLKPTGGALRSDGQEVDDCCYLSFKEIRVRDDTTYLVKYVAARLLDGRFNVAVKADDFDDSVASLTPETYRIFM